MNFSKTKHKEQSIRIIDAKKSVYFTAIALLFSVISINAQSTPPTPPTPPTVTSSGTSYSITVDNDDNETHNSSVSISQSDDAYKLKASYHKSKNNGVKKLLLEQLGKNGLKIDGNTYLWSDSKNGNEVFECKLTNGRLRIYLDLDYTSDAFLEKVKAMGQELKYYVSGSSKEKEEAKKVERAKRDMERAQRDLERAQRDLERSQRVAESAKKN
jgi:hypothetical protein